MTDLPEITEVERLTIRPGDRLIVRLATEPTMADLDDIKARVRAALRLDDSVPVLVHGPSASVSVLGQEAGP